MKCYQCHKEVNNEEVYCGNCGALLKVTDDLLNQVIEGDEQALVTLLYITYPQIVRTIIEKGLNTSNSYAMAKDVFLESLKKLKDYQNAESYLSDVLKMAKFQADQFINQYKLNVHPVQLSDQWEASVDPSFVNSVLSFYNKKRFPFKKIGIILVIVAALLIACVGGYCFIRRNDAKKKTAAAPIQSYNKVAGEFKQAFQYAQDNGVKSLDQNAYPSTYKATVLAIEVVKNRNLKNDASVLSQTLYDLNNDGKKELIMGVKDKNKFIPTGFYTVKDKKSDAIDMNVYKDVHTDSYENTFILKNKHIVIQSGNSYFEYQVSKDSVKNKKSVSKKVLKNNVNLQAHSLSELIKEYNKSHANKKIYSNVKKMIKLDESNDSYDVTGDGKKDNVSFQDSGIINNSYHYLIVGINGVEYRIKENENPLEETLNAYVLYIVRMANGSVYLVVHNTVNPHFAYSPEFYRYENHHLKKIITLGNLACNDLSSDSDSSSDSETLEDYGKEYGLLYGVFNWTIEGNQVLTYNYMQYYTTYDCYERRVYTFDHDHVKVADHAEMCDTNNSLYRTTTQKIVTYDNISLSKKGMVIPGNQKVKVAAVYWRKDIPYFELVYHHKSGFIKGLTLNESNADNEKYAAITKEEFVTNRYFKNAIMIIYV